MKFNYNFKHMDKKLYLYFIIYIYFLQLNRSVNFLRVMVITIGRFVHSTHLFLRLQPFFIQHDCNYILYYDVIIRLKEID